MVAVPSWNYPPVTARMRLFLFGGNLIAPSFPPVRLCSTRVERATICSAPVESRTFLSAARDRFDGATRLFTVLTRTPPTRAAPPRSTTPRRRRGSAGRRRRSCRSPTARCRSSAGSRGVEQLAELANNASIVAEAKLNETRASNVSDLKRDLEAARTERDEAVRLRTELQEQLIQAKDAAERQALQAQIRTLTEQVQKATTDVNTLRAALPNGDAAKKDIVSTSDETKSPAKGGGAR